MLLENAYPLENTINNPPEPLCDPFLLFKAFCKISFMVTFILSTWISENPWAAFLQDRCTCIFTKQSSSGTSPQFPSVSSKGLVRHTTEQSCAVQWVYDRRNRANSLRKAETEMRTWTEVGKNFPNLSLVLINLCSSRKKKNEEMYLWSSSATH